MAYTLLYYMAYTLPHYMAYTLPHYMFYGIQQSTGTKHWTSAHSIGNTVS